MSKSQPVQNPRAASKPSVPAGPIIPQIPGPSRLRPGNRYFNKDTYVTPNGRRNIQQNAYVFGIDLEEDEKLEAAIEDYLKEQKMEATSQGSNINVWQCQNGHFSNLVLGQDCSTCGTTIPVPPEYSVLEPYDILMRGKLDK